MKKYIQKLRAMDEQSKRSYSVKASFCITLIVIVLWGFWKSMMQ